MRRSNRRRTAVDRYALLPGRCRRRRGAGTDRLTRAATHQPEQSDAGGDEWLEAERSGKAWHAARPLCELDAGRRAGSDCERPRALSGYALPSIAQRARWNGLNKTVAGFVGRLPSQVISVILSAAKNPERQSHADNRMDSSLRYKDPVFRSSHKRFWVPAMHLSQLQRPRWRQRWNRFAVCDVGGAIFTVTLRHTVKLPSSVTLPGQAPRHSMGPL